MTAPSGDHSPGPEEARIARLCELCKVWGAIVKYFHPYLAYKEIDWDAALVQALPAVSAATSREEYRAALDGMLARLGDVLTRTFLITPAPQDRSAPPGELVVARTEDAGDQPSVRWTEDRIAIISVTDYRQFAIASLTKIDRLRSMAADNASARAVVLDLRRSGPAAPAQEDELILWYVDWVLEAALPAFLEHDVPQASLRHRMHAGYAPRAESSQPYYSAFVTKEGGVLAATGQAGVQKPLAILVNGGTQCIYHVLSGLQATGAAVLVQDGTESLGAVAERYTMKLGEGVMVQMRASELVAPDGTVGLQPDIVVPRAPTETAQDDAALEVALAALRTPRATLPRERRPASAYLQGGQEKPYAEMDLPSREYRLLALFRFWTAMHYCFPYKDLLDESWDAVLPAFIPRLEAANDALAYGLTLAELVARIQDSHGRLTGNTALDGYLGTHLPPVWLTSVEGATVVANIFDEEVRQGGLQVGDVLLAVDGEEIAALRARLAPYLPASTPQSLRWRLDSAVLGGRADGVKVVSVRDAASTVRTVPLTCTLTRVQLLALWSAQGRPHLPVFGLLPHNLGYIDLQRLTLAQVDEAFEVIRDTTGVIFDMRGYPQSTMRPIAARLTLQPVTTALFQIPELHGPDPAYWSIGHATQTVLPGGSWRYGGRVVVLINEYAQSQAEHTCLFLEAAAAVTFVGSATSGANGNVTTIALPGGLSARFTGMEVRHGDGRQLQRVGIQPHIHVEPTLEGIRQGRDEVLEAAMTFLTTSTA